MKGGGIGGWGREETVVITAVKYMKETPMLKGTNFFHIVFKCTCINFKSKLQKTDSSTVKKMLCCVYVRIQ